MTYKLSIESNSETVLMQANQISEMDSVTNNHTTMYVGLVK